MSLTQVAVISQLSEDEVLNADDIAAALRDEGDDEVSSRTVHYYRQQGILPPAYGRGDSAFGPEHLSLMREARRLRRKGVTLEEIRRRLGSPLLASSVRLSTPALPTPRTRRAPAATVAQAVQVRGGRLPRSLRFRDGFVLQCPADSDDELVARLYGAIDAILAAQSPITTKPTAERWTGTQTRSPARKRGKR